MKRKHQYPTIICNLNEQLRRVFVALAFIALSACATNKNPQSSELSASGTKRFDQADANKDGKLSRNEASDYLVNEMFESRDANQDGKMTEQEWAGGDSSRGVDFKKRDANKDGVVTKQEAMAYGRAHGVVNEIMKEADKNRDNYLERSEVKAYYADREGPVN